MVRRMSAQQARDNFGELISSVYFTKDPVIIEKNGKPYATLVSSEQYQEFVNFRAARAWEAVDRIREVNADIDPDEGYAMVTEMVEEVRRERREAARRAG